MSFSKYVSNKYNHMFLSNTRWLAIGAAIISIGGYTLFILEELSDTDED